MSQELSSYRQRETEERSRRLRKDLEQTGESYKMLPREVLGGGRIQETKGAGEDQKMREGS